MICHEILYRTQSLLADGRLPPLRINFFCELSSQMDKTNTHNLPIRKSNRLTGYDYARNGAYFVTICAKNHDAFFGFVGTATCRPTICPPGDKERPQMILYDIGRNIDIAINNIPQIYPCVYVNKYVIMPNHVHLILIIDSDQQPPNNGREVVAPTINSVIGGMKRFVSMQYRFPVWQKSFHDHIIRNKKDYRRIAEYIENNPATWREDCFYGTASTIIVPPDMTPL
jgi:putative transposase